MRVPDPAPARRLLLLALAGCALAFAAEPAPDPRVSVVATPDGCALAAPGAGPPCACADWPGALRLLAGLRIPLDRASAADLEAVPGLGPARARAIVAAREAGGGFESVAALERVRGIGPDTLRRIGPHLVASGPEECGGGGGT